MPLYVYLLITLIILLHVYIFIFEAFLWESRGPKVFRSFPKDLFAKTKALAFNQGVYNLFLAAGLLLSLFIENPVFQIQALLFFLGCVFVAGLAGALTEKKILLVQSLPALITMILVVLL